ncbi:ornithine cyclodeaminase [Burkholderia pseudomultivorans]|uniref:Ornithine cyclodeaminase n=1 Tax=Burkholderia pseudomultivorans TaxID=1207504 RepID=A0A6P2KI79_9BURK|nr:ornithine cyclodeaminase [Burkholderia pseudomultivorans]MDR8728536.1 Ornithine cyclodeaminase [Burkholderia pseudomultivorans]MDR8737242.1 Ornithine cyclodeaminase [Burkholderia pseudomultivorans]MDR8743235.1 Ornithine cyclodeaminase [Burkholderia pseudomultivorans]MDR8754788.1 Ornithine cyclodeaminase [Burkholderia pseudomultivorans]MDR8779923.1 Ornithine cyclodeaminase [Burkholderia pseudomultivorans]
MTRYLDVTSVSTLVAEVGMTQILTTMASYIEQDYRRWDTFEKTARVASHSTDGVIELMPASDARLYAFKYVNGHPKNTKADLLTVMAFGVLADVDTGYPLLLSEMTLTTAIRTAATSALVARFLARADARSMALIGNGAQSEFQAIAFHRMLGIDELRVFDIDPAATDKLVRNLAPFTGLRVIRSASAADAVRGADIVTTVTADKTNATILTPDMIEDGMHVNAVGGDCPGKTELHADVLRRARVVVEYEPQTRIEGDIQQMPADFPVVEFARIVSGAAPGRESDEQVTVFDSVGFALEDFSALRYLNAAARERDIGRELELIPAPRDPKDLYGVATGGDVRAVPVATADAVLAALRH